ncbi:MAG: hypothetical protein OEY28_07215 [Nitrospira sp.]|nr:hypothetical protein [Nitrospira sp.]
MSCSLIAATVLRRLLIVPPAVLFFAGLLIAMVPTPSAQAITLIEVAELLAHPEQYDHQDVTVTGKITDVQVATTRQGQPAYGFLLQNPAGTIKVISLGRPQAREGEFVIVEGTFTRLRQVGRSIIYNEIRALSVRPLNRLDPDLVG